jgi:hypothetical protein
MSKLANSIGLNSSAIRQRSNETSAVPTIVNLADKDLHVAAITQSPGARAATIKWEVCFKPD